MTTPASALRIEVLGPVRAWLGGQEVPLGPPRRQAVLAALAVRANHVLSRDQIIDAVWGEDPPPSAPNGVHVHVAALRRSLDPGRTRGAGDRILIGGAAGYLLRLVPGQLDLDVFEAELDRGHRLASHRDPVGAVAAFDAGLQLWKGTPFGNLTGPLVESQRLRLVELWLAVREDLIEARLARGSDRTLVADLSALVAGNRLRERPRALLMTALYRAGRTADALALYVETRRLLVEELGIEPGPQLQRVHHDILTGRDPELARAAGSNQHRSSAEPPPAPASLSQPAPAAAVPRQLPLAARHFAGRASELAALGGQLRAAAGRAGTVVISAIGGMPGVGKTTLALQWAHRVADRFPDGQLYVNLRGYDVAGQDMSPAEALRGFLDAFDVPPQRRPASFEAQVSLYRSLLASRRVLVVLDNARDAAQVRPLLPGSPRCLVLVTSRNQLTGLLVAEGAHPLRLDVLSSAEARTLIAQRVGSDRVAREPAAVDRIVASCGRLPLALAIVAARAAARPRFALATLARELAEAGSRLEALADADPGADVRSAFSWSYRGLNAGAARLFRLLAVHPGPDIATPAAASLAGVPVPDAARALAELAGAHLVDEPAPGRFACHDLLRAYAAELVSGVESPPERRAAEHRLLDHYVHTACSSDRLLQPQRAIVELHTPQPGVVPEHIAEWADAIAWFTAELPVLLAAQRRAAEAGFDSHAWELSWGLGTFLTRQGRWHEVEMTHRAARAAAQRLGDRSRQAQAQRGIASGYLQQARFKEAEPHLRAGLELCRDIGDHAGEARTHYVLSLVVGKQDRHAEALCHAEQALALYRNVGDRDGMATSLNTLGWWHAVTGDHRMALRHCARALGLHQEVGNRDGVAAAWDSLGYAHHHLGHRHEALDCYEQALGLYRELGDRYNEANTLVHVGDAHRDTGDLDAARDAWRRAFAVLDDLGHPDATDVRARLAG